MTLRMTPQQLAGHDGSDPSKPLYVSVRGCIFDMSAGRTFYGPGGPYAVFAGKECARALAFMKVQPEFCTGDLSDATEQQLKTLSDWESKFKSKYPVVGELAEA
ncbi:steroid-binding protein-like [Raphidocelis subcapitata]|uniref:Steroid-binding protein-like n=1 Tax=Raphidocelis subcapitata TaxID=307507 RepID=A0A2V0NT03_9CHLO|nr:steroid-binding protein-like [Raphidocelis subcapitata]|eukprot:GBF90808.1 steroid-binding protein-like [Raphidocelis subcapitata]